MTDGVFDARVATEAARAQYRPFPFIGLDGRDYELPHPLMLDAVQQRELQAIEADEGKTSDEFLRRFYPAEWAAIEQMPPAVQLQLLQAWNDRVNVEALDQDDDDLGKAPTGSSAIPTGAEPSKPT